MALFHGLTLFTCPNGFLEVKWPFDLRSRFWRSNGSPGLSPVAKSHAPAGESWTRRPGPYQSSSDRNSKGKGKGKKGGAKGAKGTPPMPKDLHGKWHRTQQGDPICFGFNTSSGCAEKGIKPGERCRKGLHVCAEPCCQQRHSLTEHGK